MTADTTLTSVELDGLRVLADYMKTHGLVLASAESCTAGLISSLLAELPGAGEVLDCAFTTYSIRAKQRCLGVSPDILRDNNLTSEAVARAMAEGAATCTDANVVVANTGVADDGSTGVPPGTQCYAWLFRAQDVGDASGHVVYTETRRFPGGRAAVRRASALYALSRVAHYHALPTGARQLSIDR